MLFGRKTTIIGTAVALLAATACSGSDSADPPSEDAQTSETPSAEPSDDAQTEAAAEFPDDVEGIINYAGEDREDRLYECAQQEGSFDYYTSASAAESDIKPAFEAAYPGVTTTVFTSRDVFQILEEEETAGRHNFDVLGDSHGNIVRDDNFFARFEPPAAETVIDSLRDPYFVGTHGFIMGVASNDEIVAPEDFPENWDDLLDDKWDGQVIGATGSTAALNSALIAREFGMDFLEELADRVQVQAGVTSSGVAELVIAGQAPLGWNVSSSYWQRYRLADGAPLYWHGMDPMIGVYTTHSISKNSSSPCGAALLVDWLLDPSTGQVLLAELGNASPLEGEPPLPFDIPGEDPSGWGVVYNTDPTLIEGFDTYQEFLEHWSDVYNDLFLN